MTIPQVLNVARGAIDQLSRAAAGGREMEQAREFESVFLAQMLNTMTAGLGEKTGFDGGHAESQWRTLQNEQMARQIVRGGGGFGLAEQVSRELLRQQEARQGRM
jgi:peptidoglycan hydrolase FlgJ